MIQSMFQYIERGTEKDLIADACKFRCFSRLSQPWRNRENGLDKRRKFSKKFSGNLSKVSYMQAFFFSIFMQFISYKEDKYIYAQKEINCVYIYIYA